MTQKITSSSNIVRNPPQNLLPEDEAIFAHNYAYNCPEAVLVHIKNLRIIENKAYSIEYLRTLREILPARSKVGKKDLLRHWKAYLNPNVSVDEGLWIVDEWSLNYFHWFTDTLCRYVASQDRVGIKKILLPDFFKKFEYVVKSLDLLGIKPSYYDPSAILKVKNAYVVSEIASSGNYNNAILRKTRDLLVSSIQVRPEKNIYISRAKAARRKIVNELEVTEILKDYNFEIHYFETYSFQKQIEVIASAKTLIGVHGAGLTNMMFMADHGHVIELRNAGDHHNNCYFSMASVFDHDYYYLECQGDAQATLEVNLIVDTKRLKHTLEQIFATSSADENNA